MDLIIYNGRLFTMFATDLWSNKIIRDSKKITEDTILKKWCRRFFCVPAAFAHRLTKSQPKSTTPRPYNRWKAETLSILHVLLNLGVKMTGVEGN